MESITRRRRRRLGTTIAAAVFAATLAAPATAAAGEYIVTLQPSGTTTCQQTISGVTADYNVTPTHTYTSSFCGFAVSMSPRRAQLVAADPRVASVSEDGVTRV